MKSLNQERFLYSKTGVKVYLKPEYCPALGETNLSHPDFVRKAKEVFGQRYGNIEGLPRICSENSEDAQTWIHFSPLLSMSHACMYRCKTSIMCYDIGVDSHSYYLFPFSCFDI